ncbi:hypothetical protein CPB86DRAFT_719226 [Serendipita vermifera]|nr:hypothetical protein CPB86DRAFT_719226 [Serendipita vermifera]
MERFKEENVYFVGLMPGEKQQSNLDGVLKPLVDDLSRYWTKGVLHVGIPGLDSPRLIRCAVVQLICDLPAARKVAGFPNHSATHHCSICYSTRSNIMDTSLAHEEAFRRDLASHMAHATNYKSILDKNGRRAAESLMKANPKAARWSELNRLTYWDPIRHTVLDSMHLILLGLCKFHWRKFWGGSFLSRKSTAYKHLPRQVRKVNGKYIIKQDPPSGGEIPGHEVTVSRSEELLGGLVPVPIPQIPRPENKQRSFITNEELNQIQSDLKSIIVPSWVEKPRAKFGDKSNGKVKAAEWGTLFTIYIPLTMLRLWGIEMTRALTTDYILHLKALLTLTIIVNITTSVSSSSAIIQLYDTSVHLYLRLISVLNRDRSLVVNHHLALHVSEFMKLHGPSRTHWAFPFERLIGKLQKIPHNSHIGT